MRNKRISLVLLLLMFSISVAVPSISSICMIAIVGINFILIVTKSDLELAVLSTMIMGSEVFALLNAFVSIIGLIITNGGLKKPKGTIKKNIGLVLGMILLNSIINGILNNTLVNVIFYILYLLVLVLCFTGFSDSLEVNKSIVAVKSLIIIEFVATMIRIIVKRSITPGDYFTGTLNNAHFFGNWLILTGILLFLLFKNKTLFEDVVLVSKREFFFYSIIILPMLYLADAKQIIVSLIIALLLYIIVKAFSLKKKNVLFWTIIGMYVSFFLVVWIFSLDGVKDFLITKLSFYSAYIYQEGWNGRYAFAYGTLFDSLANIRLFFGYGLGQYGSRVANAFAYSEMWRADNFINNFIANNFSPHFVPEFTRYVSYYDSNFVNLIRYRSAILSYPFSSFIALLGETGTVGTVLVANLINKYFYKSKAQLLIIYFISACIFDIYFDDFQCVIALILYLSIMKVKKNSFILLTRNNIDFKRL